MEYCKDLTKNHPTIFLYPESIECVNYLLNNEGCDIDPSPFFGSGVEVINGDKLEGSIAVATGRGLHRKAKSMDVIFGVKDKKTSAETYQFIELKLNSKSFYFLDKDSFSEKVIGSTNALGNLRTINTKYYIVFKVSNLQVGRRYLFRKHPRLDSSYNAVDINGLFNTFFL